MADIILPRLALMLNIFYGGSAGSPASILCGLGQARKGAAAADDSSAGVLLVGPPPLICVT